VRRGEADRQAIKQAEEVLKAGQVLVIFPEGTRSRTRQMKAGLPGVALIALRSEAPIVPVGIYGSERFKLWHIWPFRTPITLTYGNPFKLTREGRRGHGDLQGQLDVIMRHIAELLPPQYRGIYGADTGGAAAPAAPASLPESTADQTAPVVLSDGVAQTAASAEEEAMETGASGGSSE
jgi:1-acyl-sn-glycerol-3-phosphate acyltransferase